MPWVRTSNFNDISPSRCCLRVPGLCRTCHDSAYLCAPLACLRGACPRKDVPYPPKRLLRWLLGARALDRSAIPAPHDAQLVEMDIAVGDALRSARAVCLKQPVEAVPDLEWLAHAAGDDG